MIKPNEICGLQFTFIDMSSKDGSDYAINGIQVTYKQGDRTIQQSFPLTDPTLYSNFNDLLPLIADILNIGHD